VTPCFRVEKTLNAVAVAASRPAQGCAANRDIIRLIMLLPGTRSCWGAARYALTAFLLGVAVVYLFGGFEPAAALVN